MRGGISMIPRRLKELRKALKLTQAQFGEKLGVSRDVIGNIEYSRVNPKPVFLEHVCNIYCVNRNWLLEGFGEMFSEDPPAHSEMNEALRLFHSLNSKLRGYVLSQMRELVKLQESGGIDEMSE